MPFQFQKGDTANVQRWNARYVAAMTDTRPPEPHGLARRPLPQWARHLIAFAAGVAVAYIALRAGL